ncbi:unknown protein [Seminavis robusta]|uniref:Uncharacterized protein n=1 Tax=Seminavis robusta TaxID=568900 RepID=A0A9N8H109_9STRA|nr:unknown protein [Seminavis robusta]|eukprot:Sro31_g020090.1 n/a (282) ;mRNA; r:28609-29454
MRLTSAAQCLSTASVLYNADPSLGPSSIPVPVTTDAKLKLPLLFPPQEPSVIFLENLPPHFDVWSKISPKVQSSRYGGEVRVEWQVNNGEEGQEKAIESVLKQASGSLLSEVQRRLFVFRHSAMTTLKGIKGYKVKLAVYWGGSGTRCPAWHQDYVPVRWIQSFFGPGTEFVLPDGNNPYLERIANPDKVREIALGNDRSDWKERLMEQSGVKTHHVPGGKPVLLVGQSWNQCAKPRTEGSNKRAAVTHRSPHGLAAGEGRVLLNIDVIVADPDGACDGHH